MFEAIFPQHSKIVLAQTYRSTQTICAAVNSLIDGNSERTKKKLWTQNQQGAPIRIVVSQDAGKEIEVRVYVLKHENETNSELRFTHLIAGILIFFFFSTLVHTFWESSPTPPNTRRL